MEQGTGKTKIIIDNASHLYSQNDISAVVVLAPNGVHSNWVYNEIPTHSAVKYEAFEWKSNKGIKWTKKLNEFLTKTQEGTLKYLCLNIEAIRMKRCLTMLTKFMQQFTTLCVIDESTVIKNPKALQTKSAFQLANLAKYRRILTGTPITQSPLDMFAQAKFLHPEALGERFTWTAFKNTYAQEEVVTMGARSFRKIKGYKNIPDLTSRLNRFSVRILKKDCLDLPDKIYQNVYVDMTKEQQRLYDEMKQSAITQIESGEVTSVTSALTLLMKLQQIVSGFIKDDNDQIHHINNNRLGALLSQCGESGKYVVFCHFRENVRQIADLLGQTYGKGSVVSYFGGVSTDDRTEAVRRFADDDGVRFFISSSAGARGLTLTRAFTTIYYSQGYNLETRLQSEDRIHRIGQSEACVYLDLVTRGTTDEMITTALKNKQDLANLVLDDIKKVLI
jgi:SNF2 family DNA or RNA helicase